MTIYALFLCIKATAMCQMQGQARNTFAGPMPATTYASLSDCQKFAAQITGRIEPTPDGHFPLNDGMWYECLSKHVDTWESPSQH